MQERQRKKFQSSEKNIIKNGSAFYFRKNSPSKKTGHYENADKSFKNIKSTRLFLNKSFEQQDQSKGHSFIKIMPATTKNISQGFYKQMKELKIPSFFKKENLNKSVNQSMSSSNFQKPKNQRRAQENNVNQTSLKGSFKVIEKNKDMSNENINLELIEQSKLDNKINYLLRKINEMKEALDKKRQEKVNFLESQKRQRKKLIQIEQGSRFTSETSLKQFITQVPQHKDLHAFNHNPYSPKHSTYYVSQILRAYREQKSLARQHILCSIEYLRMFQNCRLPSDKQIQHMKVNLDRMKGYEEKKTVIFDLDETLIHCNQNMTVPSDFKIKINFPTGQVIQVGINVRPFARQILAALSKNFEIIVFTASHSSYANVVLDQLDPDKKYIHHRLFRENCYCTSQGIYVKDLRIINRPLQKMILIDNAAYSYAFQPLNGIPIIPYYEGKNDYELQALLKYIQTLIFSVDVREKNKATFKLDQYHRFDDLHTLVETLYCNIQT